MAGTLEAATAELEEAGKRQAEINRLIAVENEKLNALEAERKKRLSEKQRRMEEVQAKKRLERQVAQEQLQQAAEQQALRASVRAEIKSLVRSDETVAAMYRMQGELSTQDWERLREVTRSGGQRHSHDE